MSTYKVTNTANAPAYVGGTRFEPGETKEVSLGDEEVSNARRFFVFENEASSNEVDEESETVQDESKSEDKDSDNGGEK